MTVPPAPALRLSLDVDVTGLTDEQRRQFTEAVIDLLDKFRNEEEEPTTLGWTATTLEEALTRLDRDGGWVQAGAIRRALVNGGIVSRAEIYEIGNYEPDRMLRGFTRPTNRIVESMRAAGRIPASAVSLLEPVYVGVTAESFKVPAELASLLA
ncbi:hypothetical protein [Streptomyces cyaneofuscatus]|uniref:hypothetical protein n=1 Tax=Streptomyces cyaneofuscatus TaxID=66883 RepID=UPI0036AB8460